MNVRSQSLIKETLFHSDEKVSGHQEIAEHVNSFLLDMIKDYQQLM